MIFNFRHTKILNNIFLFFLAGHETSASALTSAVHWLGQCPDIQREAYQEVKQVLGDTGVPSVDNIPQLQYIEAVVREALRMNSTVPVLSQRIATSDTEIAGYHIPKGTVVSCNTVAGHYISKYWKDPKVFNPNRFLGEERRKNMKIMMGFSSGPRVCIGHKFAVMEMVITLSLVIQQFEWSLIPGYTWKSKIAAITTQPVGGMPLILKKRVVDTH